MAVHLRRRNADFLVSAGAAQLHAWRWPWREVLALGHLQLGLMFLLLPIQILLFHGISLTSWAANLIAVPLVTFAVVPAILLAMLLHLSGPVGVEMTVWWLADRLLAALFWFCVCCRRAGSVWIFAGQGSAHCQLMLLVWRFHAGVRYRRFVLAVRCC